jgi:F0F1-type ATP synthase membrane subunit b/b'
MAYVVYRVVKDNLDKQVSEKPLDVDRIIEDLRTKIQIAERQAESGVFEAQEQLKQYKAELKKAKEIKSKINK